MPERGDPLGGARPPWSGSKYCGTSASGIVERWVAELKQWNCGSDVTSATRPVGQDGTATPSSISIDPQKKSAAGSPEESPSHGVSTLAIVMAFVCPDGRINLAQCPVGRAFLRRPSPAAYMMVIKNMWQSTVSQPSTKQALNNYCNKTSLLKNKTYNLIRVTYLETTREGRFES